MKKPIIFSVFFFIITAISSFGQGVWIEENVNPETGWRTGMIEVNGAVYEIKPNTNLEGANLEGADLTRADLEGADLNGSNLEGSILTSANLFGVNLEGANTKDVIRPTGLWIQQIVDLDTGLRTGKIRFKGTIYTIEPNGDLSNTNLGSKDVFNNNLGASLIDDCS